MEKAPPEAGEQVNGASAWARPAGRGRSGGNCSAGRELGPADGYCGEGEHPPCGPRAASAGQRHFANEYRVWASHTAVLVCEVALPSARRTGADHPEKLRRKGTILY